jgi:UDP-GlcNAc:undecaprenyl-phosphate/decaprenyl-phosphate GlcNAc-1-phosphate transferase
MKSLMFTESELARQLILALIVSFLFGPMGLLALIGMGWALRGRYAVDSANKHGIGHQESSRLGGVVILFSSTVWVLFSMVTEGGLVWVDSVDYVTFGMISTWFLTGVGAVEDVKNGVLSPRFRLLLLISVFAMLFLMFPEVVPSSFGLALIDAVMGVPVLGVLLAVAFCVGFINAVNMADGANGLMSGIAALAFFSFSLLYGPMEWMWVILASVVSIFFLYNVVIGRLFLGDGGAYLIGSAFLVASFYAVNKSLVSLGYLAALFSYPCVEMVVTLLRRLRTGRSPLLPDNDHYHNRLHHFIKPHIKSRVLANSATGILIACTTSGSTVAIMRYELLSVTDANWWFIFAVIASLQVVSFTVLGRISQRQPQLVMDSTMAHEV